MSLRFFTDHCVPIAAGRSREVILKLYPYLEEADIAEALAYAAWRAEEIEVPLGRP
jgi:uncharacterized protein (DUF433 family)